MEGTGQGKRLKGGQKCLGSESPSGGNLSVNSVSMDLSNLHDSEFSADSTESNNHIEGGNGWFGGMGTDFRNIAHCLTDNVAPIVSGVVNVVHRTVGAFRDELAQLEQAGDAESIDRMNNGNSYESFKSNPFLLSTKVDTKAQSMMLPWEIMKETANGHDNNIPVYFTHDMLMEDILSLSNNESTFLTPFQADGEDGTSFLEESSSKSTSILREFVSTFVMDECRIKMIRRLMDIDKSLASMHSQFSGKSVVKEEVFWKNYFYHCELLRNEHLGWNGTTQHSTAISSPMLMVGATANNAKVRRALDRVVSSIAVDNDSEDDASLIPAHSASEEDDSSYVIASAPNSVNTFPTSRSIDDLVVINTPLNSRGVG